MPVLHDIAYSLLCCPSFSDQCFASGYKPSGVRRAWWLFASGAWKDQPPAGGLQGPPHKVTYIHPRTWVRSLKFNQCIELCFYIYVTQAVHQVTAKGSGHSSVLRKTWEMEPGMIPNNIDCFIVFIWWFASCCSVCFKAFACLFLQVDPALRMDVVEPGHGRSRVVLFQLHPVTLLNRWKAVVHVFVLKRIWCTMIIYMEF